MFGAQTTSEGVGRPRPRPGRAKPGSRRRKRTRLMAQPAPPDGASGPTRVTAPMLFSPAPPDPISPGWPRPRSALQKFEQCVLGEGSAEHRRTSGKIPSSADDKKPCSGRTAALREARGFRRRVSIKCRALDLAAARPESRADHFMRVGFARDRSRLLRAPGRAVRKSA